MAKTREEILQSLKTHLEECKTEFELCIDESEDATIEEIELSGRIDTLKWAINLFEEE